MPSAVTIGAGVEPSQSRASAVAPDRAERREQPYCGFGLCFIRDALDFDIVFGLRNKGYPAALLGGGRLARWGVSLDSYGI